ncbi:MAG: hypothetical protein HYZ26_07985 [Chloroflexi bacterium]|nr:hypothetical protein [Chloroflexota bacterium]
MRRPVYTPIALALWGLLFVGCRTQSSAVTAISLDFPHGETYLVVQREGVARLGYGALLGDPVRGEAFNIDILFEQLQERIQPVEPAEDRPLGQLYGMVTFYFEDETTQSYLIYDREFAETLFEVARQNLIESVPSPATP